MSQSKTGNGSSGAHFDVIVVGAGFGGVYALHRLREAGISVRLLEAASGVGGVWYQNRYPGARCDVESLEYQFGFSDAVQKSWTWTERYATQPEIQRYFEHVVDCLDLSADMQFSTRVDSAHFDEAKKLWRIETDTGERITARFCVMATGQLSAARIPDIDGLSDFGGKWFHTSDWPKEGVDFTGQRVAVIGTGSSGIQSIPLIAEQASKLYVMQRTAVYSIPANNAELDPEVVERSHENLLEDRARAHENVAGALIPTGDVSLLDMTPEEQETVLTKLWKQGGFPFQFHFPDLMVNEEANEIAAAFLRRKIQEIVKDPETARILTPNDHPLGTKRLCLDTNYYQTFNLPHVELVDIKANPIDCITTKGLRSGGRDYEVDAIVFATGFDAFTGALSKIDIKGRGGLSLQDKWSSGPGNYLGLGTAGFPNMFFVAGPGSPSIFAVAVVQVEQHVDWIEQCISYLNDKGFATIEPTQEAEDEWIDHVNEVASYTLFPKANSWYLGANIPGKPRVFMPYIGGYHNYRQRCFEVAEAGYEGFKLEA